ncbi:hypothetical protein AAG906_005471 [Vitis piasezkii]
MILRSLQPRISRHVVGVPFTNFGSLVLALPHRHHQPVPQPTRTYPSYSPHQYRPRAPSHHMIKLTCLSH